MTHSVYCAIQLSDEKIQRFSDRQVPLDQDPYYYNSRGDDLLVMTPYIDLDLKSLQTITGWKGQSQTIVGRKLTYRHLETHDSKSSSLRLELWLPMRHAWDCLEITFRSHASATKPIRHG